MKQSAQTVGFVGVGNMGEALLAGLISAGAPKSSITFVQRSPERAKTISERYGISQVSLADVAKSDCILLCVKPKDIEGICTQLAQHVNSESLIVSFAAGKRIETIESALGGNVGVIRVMPNTPTFIGKGASGISLGKYVTDDQSAFVRRFLNASGITVEVDESLQSAVTGTSGSGPAYFFAFVEAMVAGGVKLGLSEEDASALTLQTIVGAAGMLEKSGKSATQLREEVTSPNGATFAALNVFHERKLAEIVADAMAASAKRTEELA